MTMAQSLIAFLAAATLVTVTPGLDTVLVLRATASEGRRAGAWAAVGVGVGCLVWGAAVALGLAAILAASAAAFAVIRWAGAAYLLWLGVKLIARPRTSLDEAGPPVGGHPFQRGLVTNLLNPKVGVFYISFLPQFVPAAVNTPAWTFMLACIHVALGLGWFSILIPAISGVRRLLARRGVISALDRLTGCVFVAFGLDLALARRT
jgi:threonine/homoserine/homoserine lactone efflux protein